MPTLLVIAVTVIYEGDIQILLAMSSNSFARSSISAAPQFFCLRIQSFSFIRVDNSSPGTNSAKKFTSLSSPKSSRKTEPNRDSLRI
jgi:hypothetical protein